MQAMTPKEMMQSYLQGCFRDSLRKFEGKSLTPDLMSEIKDTLMATLKDLCAPQVEVQVCQMPDGNIQIQILPVDRPEEDNENV